ncbi:zinc finger protein, putative [Plasmodium sp. gorilla clade G2]|uniref:zinc finger protein, putative n=1 Tax=Plasmodium sp. gorilla clade G2 TaxID=880535 RepID=UPI000D216425|nr:zinc finger protein, putative [Plasmodium sp. gorilla clade G2]SOV18405.1 zinc finger protein, putative [Plasmodium sp. gorilla clade G2]
MSTEYTDKEKIESMDDTIEVRSMCINCEKEGLNKIVKINIPYFKNVLIHSFECEFCNYKNNVIQDLNQIKDKGVKICMKINNEELFDRQLIKSEYGVLKIPEIDFEIPKETQKGSINTIEGFLHTALNNLTIYLKEIKSMYNEVNNITTNGKTETSETIEKNETDEVKLNSKEDLEQKDNKVSTIDEEINNNIDENDNEDNSGANTNGTCQQITIENYIKMIEKTVQNLSKFVILKEFPFTIQIIDPSGLSSLEHYEDDIKYKIVDIEYYDRTKEELHELGFYEESFEENEKTNDINSNMTGMNTNEKQDIKKENFDFIKKYIHMNDNNNNDNIHASNNNTNSTMKYKTISNEEEAKLIESFASNCPCCNHMGMNNFCEINIPGFKKCLILSFVCPNCNFKTSEIKSSGEINPKGKKITLTVNNKNDLNRFVIKSETASINIPVVELTSDYGTLGGTLTTVEGLIMKIIESLEEKFKFLLGDSNINTHQYENENIPDALNKNVDTTSSKIRELIKKLYKLCKTEEFCPYDLIIDDIASNSYISSDIVGEDPNLKEEEYERTYEQNDMLGLTSMQTENY